ncbi:MAG TPA: hypothetical protein VIY49_30725 [Bryobacteraceae bacterium]
MAQPFDVKRLETTGEAMSVAQGIPTYSGLSRRAAFTVSPSGLLAYIAAAPRGYSHLVWKDRQGNALGDLGQTTDPIGDIALSPDGKRLAVTIQDQSGSADVWIYDTARGTPMRFTFDSKVYGESVWSPDGSVLYFNSAQKGVLDLFRKVSNGAANEELVFADHANKRWTSISPDGRLLLYDSFGEKPEGDIWVMSSASGGKSEPRIFLQTPSSKRDGQLSPDGRWLAYESNESGPVQVYAAPFPGPGGKRQISPAGGGRPRWRRDGKEIFFCTQDGQLMAAEVATSNGTLEVGQVHKLFDGIITTNLGLTYDASADGRKFVVLESSASTAGPLTLVQNWLAALRK